MLNIFNKNISSRRKLIYRIVVHSSKGTNTGTGFFINNEGYFLSCFHVAFGKELRHLKGISEFKQTKGVSEHEKLENWYRANIIKTEIECFDKSRYTAELKKFDEKYDVALFKVDAPASKIKFCKIDWNYSINYGDRVSFGGFPTHHGYPADKTPFAVNEGMVSSFVKTIIAGGEYEHALVNSINLPGNSGAPLFKGTSSIVIGVVNGNMNYGRDDVVVEDSNQKRVKSSLRIPLSLAYATPIKLLKSFVDKAEGF